ncbi:hypothetical protein L210DRAFT_2426953 [Boletus edulis BED1]|uniref:Uncharacterized protein n=1 Tax=Boletus edulis BED1 TaxID=1328754 RepID=A0AAD4C7D5_BOLED|nr:hypothetical protein L210DRAFT_2426953 [Boletus edulis BED1]
MDTYLLRMPEPMSTLPSNDPDWRCRHCRSRRVVPMRNGHRPSSRRELVAFADEIADALARAVGQECKEREMTDRLMILSLRKVEVNEDAPRTEFFKKYTVIMTVLNFRSTVLPAVGGSGDAAVHLCCYKMDSLCVCLPGARDLEDCAAVQQSILEESLWPFGLIGPCAKATGGELIFSRALPHTSFCRVIPSLYRVRCQVRRNMPLRR